MTVQEAIDAINRAPSVDALKVAQDVIDKIPEPERSMVGPDLEEMAALRQSPPVPQ